MPVFIKPPLAACFVLVCLVLSGFLRGQEPELPAGHSSHGEVFNEGPRQSAYLMAGCGNASFPVTCDQDLTQKFFNQGIGQLHGFWHFESERSFRQAAAREPDCAMSYWGMAMANVDNPDRAAGFIEEAVVRREQASARERMWIDTLAAYYEVTAESAKLSLAKRDKDSDEKRSTPAKRKFKKSKKDRSGKLVRGYESIVDQYPDDLEAMAFLANRLWLNRRASLPTNSHMSIELMLRRIFEKNPVHPAHHYRIHLWDREKAARALVSAQQSGQSSPGVAHQWHMSGHIFAKLNRHEDAVYQQSASARVDHAHMMRDGVMPYKIHNYGHNNEWLARSLNHAGQPSNALALAQNMIEMPRHPEKNRVESRGSIGGYGTRRVIDTCRNYYLRSSLRSLQARGYLAGGDSEGTDVAVIGEIGQAFFLMGDVPSGRDQIAVLVAMKEAAAAREGSEKAAKARAKKGKGDKKSKDKVADAKPELDPDPNLEPKPESKPKPKPKPGRASVKSIEKMLAELRTLEAVCEQRVEDARKGLKKSRLPKFCKAMCYSAIGDHKEAQKLIDAEDKKNPNRCEVIARQVLIRWAAKDKAGATTAFDRLRVAAGSSEVDVPLLRKLAPIAKALNYPEDWRLPRQQPKDVGLRPDLADLGPFRWQPSPAKNWKLPTAGGGEISLADYRGKAVLVIFYLGFGCLHCVEQLQHFHPMVEKYRKAGIEIMGIGTDSVKGVAKSLDAMAAESRIGFPLAADPKMKVFKQWRAFDDFERTPLHGTFLVDGAGMVRWSDISYEPFDKPEYLLEECKRLLAQGSN
jgi:peroxiredoxin